MTSFVCPHCGMVNIDCGKEGYKTCKEVELETEVAKLKYLIKNFLNSPRIFDDATIPNSVKAGIEPAEKYAEQIVVNIPIVFATAFTCRRIF